MVLQCLAEAESPTDLFRRLEACGQLLRLDPAVEPTMFRGAIVSQAEHESLKQIERVVRQGRVRRIDTDRIVLDEGEVPTDRRHHPRRLHRLRAAGDARRDPSSRADESRRSRSWAASPPSTPRWSASSRRRARTTPTRTGSARRPPTPSRSIDWISVVRGRLPRPRSDADGAGHGGLAGTLPAQHDPRHERPPRRHPHASGAREVVRAPRARARQRGAAARVRLVT